VLNGLKRISCAICTAFGIVTPIVEFDVEQAVLDEAAIENSDAEKGGGEADAIAEGSGEGQCCWYAVSLLVLMSPESRVLEVEAVEEEVVAVVAVASVPVFVMANGAGYHIGARQNGGRCRVPTQSVTISSGCLFFQRLNSNSS
jgi:hypothetical protein